MTVSYQYKVASSTSGGFTRLLFMWRGSLYKLIYRELVIFLLAFDILSILYRNLFTAEQKQIFEKLVTYCDTFINLIPLTFILGFYVAYVASRWWQQYEAIPWPDRAMHTLALYLPGNDENIRIIRRTLMRYLNLTLVLILRSISSAVKKRFPTVDHLTEVGFMTQAEKQIFMSVPSNEFNTYWIPCTWFIHVLKDMKEDNPKLDPMGLKLIMEEFNEFRAKCGLLWSYDWISIPLVYTQVVTLATYSFFIAAVVGRQYVEHSNKPMQMEIDIYLPVFTILQFFFFMGLLKVAEQLINPFGDDDEDFELNWLIDRHTKVSYLGVDTLMLQKPPLSKDKYFDDDDLVLPYTEASVMYKKRTFRGSVHYLQVPEDLQNMYLPEIVEEQELENNLRGSIKYRKPSTYINEEDFSSGHWRQTADSVENGKNPKKPPDGEEILVNNIKFKRASPSLSRKNTLNLDSSLSNLSTASDDDRKRQKVTKHNSLMYPSRRRLSTKRFSEVDLFRRKSMAALSTRDTATLSRTSSKWSLHRDSAVDAQWKGIRWKPFPREGIYSIKPETDVSENRSQVASFPDDYVYVNQAFNNSQIEELNASNLIKNEKKDEDCFRIKSKKSDKSDAHLQDSLV